MGRDLGAVDGHDDDPPEWLEEIRAGLAQQRDLEEIKQLKARYCRLVDTHEWEAWVQECFTIDVHLDIVGAIHEGRDAALAMMYRFLVESSTVHHVHAPEITFTGPDTAEGIWAMDDWVRTGGEKPRAFHGQGHYHETYVRTDEGWRISTMQLTRLRVDPLPRE